MTKKNQVIKHRPTEEIQADIYEVTDRLNNFGRIYFQSMAKFSKRCLAKGNVVDNAYDAAMDATFDTTVSLQKKLTSLEAELKAATAEYSDFVLEYKINVTFDAINQSLEGIELDSDDKLIMTNAHLIMTDAQRLQTGWLCNHFKSLSGVDPYIWYKSANKQK